MFGHTKFEINDTNLVHPRGYGHAILTRNHATVSDAILRSEIVGLTVCTTWDVCIPYLVARTTGSGCYQQFQVEYCTTSYYEIDSGSGGGVVAAEGGVIILVETFRLLVETPAVAVRLDGHQFLTIVRYHSIL